MEVNNTFITYNYLTNDEEKVPIVRNWPERRPTFYSEFTKTGTEACKAFDGVFNILTENSNPNKTKPYFPYITGS